MSRYICVYDFETLNTDEEGIDPHTCKPIEFAAIMLDPYNLDMIDSSAFSSLIKPKGINSADFYEKHKKSIDWHCKNRNTTPEEFIAMLKKAPNVDVVFGLMKTYINKYNKDGTDWNAPIQCGVNIVNFDKIILERLNKSNARLFNHELIDLRQTFFELLIWNHQLRRRNMDTLRKYFGLSEGKGNAHEALQDVKDEAKIASRFLKWFKNIGAKYQYFEGAFAEEQ